VYWQAEWRAGCAAVPAAPGRHPGRPVPQLRLERSQDDAPLCHWWDFFLTFLVRAFVSHLIDEKYYVWHLLIPTVSVFVIYDYWKKFDLANFCHPTSIPDLWHFGTDPDPGPTPFFNER
jgi:hypothetical protein